MLKRKMPPFFDVTRDALFYMPQHALEGVTCTIAGRLKLIQQLMAAQGIHKALHLLYGTCRLVLKRGKAGKYKVQPIQDAGYHKEDLIRGRQMLVRCQKIQLELALHSSDDDPAHDWVSKAHPSLCAHGASCLSTSGSM
jgi:hypothetical protein